MLKSWHNPDADASDVLSSESMDCAVEFLEVGFPEPNDETGDSGGEMLLLILLVAD